MIAQSQTSLNLLVNQSMVSMSPVLKKKQVLNQVDPALQTATCAGTLNQVLCNLLNHAAGFSSTADIRISAKSFHNVVIMQIRYQGGQSEVDNDKHFALVKTLLLNMGGCIYVNNSKQHETTISITFLNQKLKRVA